MLVCVRVLARGLASVSELGGTGRSIILKHFQRRQCMIWHPTKSAYRRDEIEPQPIEKEVKERTMSYLQRVGYCPEIVTK